MKNKFMFLGIILLTAIIGIFTAACGGTEGADGFERPADPEAMSGKTAMQFFTDNDIKAGWNLGNTLDAVEFSGNKPTKAVETAWGNPQATQQLFNGVVQSGFDIVRIPCTWIGHIGSAPNYKISEARLQRVAKIIDFARAAGVKAVIINIHHDGNYTQSERGTWGFVDFSAAVNNAAKKNEIQNQIDKVWTQIAEYFKNYGDYLIFETLNEVHSGNWGSGSNGDPAYQNQQNILFDWNQAALSAIRATGGNNAARFVAVPGLGGTEPGVVAAAHSRGKLLPNDGANGTNKLIVSVHFYDPSQYTVAEANNASWPLIHTWGTSAEKERLAHEVELLKTNFLDNGIAVYIGEWGAPTDVRSGMSATVKNTHISYINAVAAAARANGVVPIYWDDGGNFKMLERSNGRPKTGLWADVLSAIMMNVK
ncbi:MAG: glycoside hydrolase family 5 protein [Treponema sp.]|nr:glycoside hydrolase family 5 protein [Treponema sp.]